jgi:hypothetical protein
MTPIEGGKGFVEVVTLSEKDGTIAVYFLKADGSGPLEPPPTDVKFTPGAEKSPLNLGPTGDHFTSGQHAIKKGRTPDGVISARLGGVEVSVSVDSR